MGQRHSAAAHDEVVERVWRSPTSFSSRDRSSRDVGSLMIGRRRCPTAAAYGHPVRPVGYPNARATHTVGATCELVDWRSRMKVAELFTISTSPSQRVRDDELDLFGLTHAGKVRKENQDHFLVCTVHPEVV